MGVWGYGGMMGVWGYEGMMGVWRDGGRMRAGVSKKGGRWWGV